MIDDGHLFIVTRAAETAALIEAFLADASKRVDPSSPISRMAGWVRDIIPTFGGAAMSWRSEKGGTDDESAGKLNRENGLRAASHRR
jgi:hypothetical protein